MNTIKKITEESVLEDFEKIMVFNTVNKIKHFFRYGSKYEPGGVKYDYKAFWNARKAFNEFREKCRLEGRQDKTYTHAVYNTLEKFDRCGLSQKAVKAIFRGGVSNYGQLTAKYLLQPHGTLTVHTSDGKRQTLQFKNIYSPSFDELQDIFEHPDKLKMITNLRGGYYTKRQKHIIYKYVAPKKNGEKKLEADDIEPQEEHHGAIEETTFDNDIDFYMGVAQ